MKPSFEVKYWYILKWRSAPHPPAHKNYMDGAQSFDTMEDAIKFFKKLNSDSEFISLTEIEHSEADISHIFLEQIN